MTKNANIRAGSAVQDERLAQVLLDWWFHDPLFVDDDAATDEASAMADVRSLLRALTDAGYDIVHES